LRCRWWRIPEREIIGGMRNSFAALFLLILAGCESAPKVAEPVKKKEPPPPVYRVKLETTKGDIVIEVQRDWAPRGADHFHELVSARYYDGVKFHRVMKTFVAQFGINGDPKIDLIYALTRIGDDPVKEKNKRGTITYAKLGANSRTTEVFINLRDNPILDTTGFVPFGKVVDGMDVADKLAYLYGELAPRGSGPDATKIHREGNSYLNRDFPRLDAIKRAVIQ
jgi:peptidyl-prolyl cis-trans isomerase A (cyclophilin A)